MHYIYIYVFNIIYIYLVELCWVDILNILLTLISQSMDGLHQNSRFCGAIGTPILSFFRTRLRGLPVGLANRVLGTSVEQSKSVTRPVPGHPFRGWGPFFDLISVTLW